MIGSLIVPADRKPELREMWEERVAAAVDLAHAENLGGRHREGFCGACADAYLVAQRAVPAGPGEDDLPFSYPFIFEQVVGEVVGELEQASAVRRVQGKPRLTGEDWADHLTRWASERMKEEHDG